MVNCPEIGDIVYFSCNKKKVLIGKVIQGFTPGILHQKCDYNIKPTNTIPTHQAPKEFAIIEITAIGNNEEFKGVQRTWSKIRD
jgi:hypothetical protein